jgi:hypothetical protein
MVVPGYLLTGKKFHRQVRQEKTRFGSFSGFKVQ